MFAALLRGALVGVLLAAPADAAVVSPKAVKLNGAAIAPTNNLNIVPGDQVTAEIFLIGWTSDPLIGGVHAYQVAIPGDGFFSGTHGSVLPCGWNAPRDPIGCTSSDDCPEGYPVCAIGVRGQTRNTACEGKDQNDGERTKLLGPAFVVTLGGMPGADPTLWRRAHTSTS